MIDTNELINKTIGFLKKVRSIILVVMFSVAGLVFLAGGIYVNANS